MEKWHEHVPEGAVENEEVKVLWDINFQCDNVMEVRRPDIIAISKKERKWIIINIALLGGARILRKVLEKLRRAKRRNDGNGNSQNMMLNNRS